jgi:3-deoxy-manno-octulosonate cytidylyltransferase (CMP-KDO synthetase)
VVVNVQGDEPFIPAAIIRQVAHNLHANADADMATLGCRIDDIHEFYNPNAVKVVRDHAGMAMYFSRSPMPYVRDAMLDGQQTVSADNCQLDLARFEFLRHIGIYGYRAGYLRHYTSLPMTTLEQLESLEQLRVLYHGGNIHVDIALENPPPGIDTPEDLADLEL